MIPNDLYIWKLICCIFLNKREVLSRFFEKFYIFQYFSTCQTRSDDFWILNAMCMFIYLFVVYFSYAPVISAITHRYCELFYIQVLMMVIITETLTSTSHHDIFTYLDYIFSCYLHLIDKYKENLALNNMQRLICHKTKPTEPSFFITLKIKFWKMR